MKRVLAVLIASALSMALLEGCGGKTSSGSAESAPAEAEAESQEETEEAPEESAQQSTGPFTWGEITFEFTGLEENPEGWKKEEKYYTIGGEKAGDFDVNPADGKYVMARFSITGGAINIKELEEYIVTQQAVMLNDEYAPAAYWSGVTIGQLDGKDAAFTSTLFGVFFDVPEDLDAGSAAVTVK